MLISLSLSLGRRADLYPYRSVSCCDRTGKHGIANKSGRKASRGLKYVEMKQGSQTYLPDEPAFQILASCSGVTDSCPCLPEQDRLLGHCSRSGQTTFPPRRSLICCRCRLSPPPAALRRRQHKVHPRQAGRRLFVLDFLSCSSLFRARTVL
ncbi:hypothetical protein PYCCODRAFT_371908 [Trametes coccinea BRFM310]|uniref:Uncharacterized protein n=1 Tax=Trametes coccinea (strain BRFM310) TaxID=1353009 RepID=A0A1Y2J3I6_TRAC3|nr:hypothetical protein PYCCODRAFT_371908 [Trametes coccinea BRFM310]